MRHAHTIRTLALAVASLASAQASASGHPLNPGGFPVGGTARFRISIVEGSVPPEKIIWHIVSGSGNVSFVGGNAGNDVILRGIAPGDFKLEVDIAGMAITPPHVRPFFTGTAYPAVNVPAVIYIVRDDYGGNPARDPAQIPGLLAEANDILWQRGYTLVWDGAVRYINNSAWLNHTDAFNPATNTSHYTMFGTTNCMGKAVELYFVRSLKTGQGKELAGLHSARGIAIASLRDNNAAYTLEQSGWATGHEVLHGCGAEDIYTTDDSGNNPVTGPVTSENLPLDFGGGYHNPDLPYSQLLDRLIMCSGGTGTGIVLPRGSFYGYTDAAAAGAPRELRLVKVGLDSCTKFPGSY